MNIEYISRQKLHRLSLMSGDERKMKLKVKMEDYYD